MENSYIAKRSICMVLILVLIMCLTGCSRFREKKYYADTGNFISNVYWRRRNSEFRGRAQEPNEIILMFQTENTILPEVVVGIIGKQGNLNIEEN